MFGDTLALCADCRARVPARHEVRDGKIFLVKDCPTCGRNEALVSTDAVAWQKKRQIWGYDPNEAKECRLHCDACGSDHAPQVVLVEMTNRCNMNCPVCIATVQSVGFDYHPPLAYFDKLFKALAQFDSQPFVEFYGGEPTLRDDLIDLVRLARRRYDLKVRVVTNGLKLADEEYARKLCAIKVPLRFGFDGRDPEIYRRLRGTVRVYEPKLRGLENLRKFSTRKHAILTCLGIGINDQHVGDLLDLCHEYRSVIDHIGFIPLKEDWHAKERKLDHQTTPEEVEQAVKNAVPDGNVEFIPAGIVHCLSRARAFFTDRKRSRNFLFAGSHPNCESMTFLVSDGTHFRSINHYLNIPLSDLTQDILTRARQLDQKLNRMNPKKFLHRWYGRFLAVKTFLRPGLRAVNFRAIFKGNPLVAATKVLCGPLRGRRIWDELRRVTGIPAFLRVGILPFEEYLAVDAQRLANCKGVFAYEDVTDGKVKTIPVCMWFLYRKEILRTIAEKYGVAPPAALAGEPDSDGSKHATTAQPTA